MLKKTILDIENSSSIISLRNLLFSEIYAAIKQNKTIIVLCIGTDRSTGDSLGPLVGDKLKLLLKDKANIYGCLQFPVHAKNINNVLNNIYEVYESPFIIAIDACLGNINNVGKVIIDNSPLKPGSALDKDLPPVGDISITGVVNISGGMDFVMLQNTRLYTVMTLADSIAKGIYYCYLKIQGFVEQSKKVSSSL